MRTLLAWDAVDDPGLAGYKIYWRDTTAPQWQHSRFVGSMTQYTLEHVVIDNFLFGVASVGTAATRALSSFPGDPIRP